MAQLTTGDLANFWAEGRTSPMQIAVAGVLRGADATFDLETARATLARAVSDTPALRKKVRWTRAWQGAPTWLDENPNDLVERVQQVVLEAPVTRDAFFAWCATEAARPLDRRGHLWRITFVRAVGNGDVGLLMVLHHAVADGLRGVRMLSSLFGGSVEHLSPPPAHAPGGRTSGAHAAKRLKPALAMLREVGARAPRTPLTRALSASRQLFVVRRPLDGLRAAGHGLDATLNDLMLAAVTTGLRAWLLSRGPLNDPGLCLRASVPTGGSESNAGGVMLVPLPVGEPDSKARLEAITKFTRAAKLRRMTSGDGWNAPSLPRPVSWGWVRLLRRFGRTRVNLYVTNVPGPRAPLSFAGYRIDALTPISPLVAGVACSVAILSYAGELSVSVNADGELEGMDCLAAGIARELDGLVQWASDRGVRGDALLL